MTKAEKKAVEETLELLRWAWKKNPSGRAFYVDVATKLKAMSK